MSLPLNREHRLCCPLGLFFDGYRSTVVIAVEDKVDAVVHEVGAAYVPRFGHLCGIDGLQLVRGGFVQAAQVDSWEGRPELLRMQEGKEHRLAAILGNVLCGGSFAA